MGKRGQIYILAAILLAVIIYGLSIVVNFVEQEEIKGDFESLSKNYEVESSKLVNSVLQSGENVPSAFANFTLLFTSYSKAKSPNFYIFYALPYGDNLFIGNFMRDSIYVYKDCSEADKGYDLRVDGCLSDIPAQLGFEGLGIPVNIDLTTLKEKCVGSLVMEPSVSEYCVRIGGMMHSLPIDKNVPRIYGFSSLKSGSNILQSVQGFGKGQFCGGDETQCKKNWEFCCWSGGKCLEGQCETLGCSCDVGYCTCTSTGGFCIDGNCSKHSSCLAEGTENCDTKPEPCCPSFWCDLTLGTPKCGGFWTD